MTKWQAPWTGVYSGQDEEKIQGRCESDNQAKQTTPVKRRRAKERSRGRVNRDV